MGDLLEEQCADSQSVLKNTIRDLREELAMYQARVAELETELAQVVIIGKKLPAILEYHDDADR